MTPPTNSGVPPRSNKGTKDDRGPDDEQLQGQERHPGGWGYAPCQERTGDLGAGHRSPASPK